MFIHRKKEAVNLAANKDKALVVVLHYVHDKIRT